MSLISPGRNGRGSVAADSFETQHSHVIILHAKTISICQECHLWLNRVWYLTTALDRKASFKISISAIINIACPSIDVTSASSNMAASLNAVSRLALPLGIAIAIGQSAIYDVRGGSRAVIFDRLSGVQEKVISEGTHFLIPWLQKSIIYDVRTKPRNISTTTGSKDLQMVTLTLRVLHRPEVQQLPKIYQVCT